MFYLLKDGTKIKVGKQDLLNGTVDVEIDGTYIKCPMYSEEDGDIGFVIQNEEILFHWLKTEKEITSLTRCIKNGVANETD